MCIIHKKYHALNEIILFAFFIIWRIPLTLNFFCNFVSLMAYLKSGSHFVKRNFFIYSNASPSKMMKNAFYFILKALFILKIFKFLSWIFGHVEQTAWLEKQGWFRNFWRHILVNKELKHTYIAQYLTN